MRLARARRTVAVIDRSEGAAMKKSLAVTLSAAAVIVVLALATLTVLSALAGQQSGHEHAKPAVSATG